MEENYDEIIGHLELQVRAKNDAIPAERIVIDSQLYLLAYASPTAEKPFMRIAMGDVFCVRLSDASTPLQPSPTSLPL
jgi:hypothetical protein